MADNQTTVVRIESGNHGGNTRVGVNGAKIEIPHGKDTPVHVDYADALVNSNVEFTIVSGAIPRALAPAAEGEGALPSAADASIPVNESGSDRSEIPVDRQDAETPDGAEKAEDSGGAGPIDGNAAPTAAPPEMTQGSQGHVGMTEEQKAKEPKTTPEPGLDNQDAHKSAGEKAEDVDTRRAAADDAARKEAEAKAKADEGDGELDGKPFVSADVLSGSIARISENLDEFTPRQLRSLIAAEEKGANRTTLLEALNKRLG